MPTIHTVGIDEIIQALGLPPGTTANCETVEFELPGEMAHYKVVQNELQGYRFAVPDSGPPRAWSREKPGILNCVVLAYSAREATRLAGVTPCVS